MPCKSFVDGYTESKRRAHIASVMVFLLVAALMAFFAWRYRGHAEHLYRTLMAFAAIIGIVMLLALIPIMSRPVVAGRRIRIASACPASSEEDC